MLQMSTEGKKSDSGNFIAPNRWFNRGIPHWNSAVRTRTLIQIASSAVAASALLPAHASAHVKWFMSYDVTQAPTLVGNVLTAQFLMLFTGFALLVFAGVMVDRYIADKWPVIAKEAQRADFEERLLRAGMGGFFMALFAAGGVILTPELRTDADWPSWLQLAIAISMLSNRTCILGGAGIAILYAYGVSCYGAFHLADYPIFLGIACYFVLTSFASERLRSLRIPIMCITLCVSLMWGAIEKWAYPEWTLALLAQRPYLTAGFSPDKFLLFAGFVEFALAFYILAGFSLIRPAIFALLSIFVAAILDFGKIDAIGHLPIMVPLLMMLIHGPCRLHRWFHGAGNSAIDHGHKVSVAFATSVCLFFAAYYGLQYEEYGRALPQGTRVSLQMSHVH
jgi:hypothetical protein